ncbi:Phosphomannomutase [Prosthecochloris aestuarii DSM 271]|uniref:Phosphomannomutase n=1 Tax=Prosthecochloris aestuarii (strain DSM 271 / SK 413) TaxID=290512 RepID=B4S4X0_PROA2|nr:phosphoglucomutase/phosphomannomutase family protein [Prosthecochloris aestuarii]ACF45468.1 Phosphomannomutase [Prosthecochloris aestuarii DSM 271]
MQVKFGTDGWRAIIAEEFTFANLKRVTLAAAEYFLNQPDSLRGICLGYDTRFMSADFARYSAEIFSSKGLRVFLSDSFVPTPAVSLYTKEKKLAGGVVITASHNPPVYNGFKIKDSYGGSAHPQSIAIIEENLEHVDAEEPIVPNEHLIELTDIKEFYLQNLSRNIDLKSIHDTQMTIAHNAMFGAGQQIISGLFDESTVSNYHCSLNPGFMGINPEPVAQNVMDFVDFVKEVKTDVAIINDGDADRVGMLDENGSFIDSHKIFAIVLKYLVEDRGEKGEIAKTFALTDVIDSICRKHDLPLHILPVGFKHVSKLMTTSNILMGGEESGGIGITSYLPERDGIYIGLLVLEIMAKKKMTLGELVKELFDEYGYFYYERHDLHVSQEKKQAIMRRAAGGDITAIGPYPVTRFNDLDGYKYHFKGGWLLIRPSGTEPVLRIYCEADSREKAQKALAFAEKIA